MEKYLASQVFVPGGLPQITYNPRNSKQLENKLLSATDNLCKLVMVTGSTKSGKTVLTNKVFPRDKAIWYDGGTFSDEETFWQDLTTFLDCYTEVSEQSTSDQAHSISTMVGADGGFLLFKVKTEGGYEYAQSNSKGTQKTKKLSSKAATLTFLRQTKIPLIIDDFHYLPREEQGVIVRAVKSLIFDGQPVIFIAIPHRKLDAVKVEREMTGRVETIEIPVWENQELQEIANIGFPLLNIKVEKKLIEELGKEAVGSPHLMQEFCRAICDHLKVKETLADEIHLTKYSEIEKIFHQVAANTGRVVFDKLSKGPRQRTDRILRTLKNGKKTDIYGVVLYALAELKLGIETIEYEDLRGGIKNILKDKVPQAHEVSRVLDYMSKIAAKDESSTPVIDWEKDERKLHITDPFFAYYLKWGLDK